MDQRLLFLDRNTSNTLPGDPATTTTREVTLRIDHSGNNVITPPAGPNPPTTTPPPPNNTLGITVSPATVNVGGSVTVSWTGVNATDVYWFIRQVGNSTNFVHLGTCSKSTAPSSSSIPTSGSCQMSIFTPGTHSFELRHYSPGISDQLIATSNPVTVN